MIAWGCASVLRLIGGQSYSLVRPWATPKGFEHFVARRECQWSRLLNVTLAVCQCPSCWLSHTIMLTPHLFKFVCALSTRPFASHLQSHNHECDSPVTQWCWYDQTFIPERWTTLSYIFKGLHRFCWSPWSSWFNDPRFIPCAVSIQKKKGYIQYSEFPRLKGPTRRTRVRRCSISFINICGGDVQFNASTW